MSEEMMKPRNTLLVVRLAEKAEQQVGKIVVSDAEEQYTEAEVLAVGPGTISASGGREETFDLKPGQRVMVKHKERVNPNPSMPLRSAGIRYIHNGEVLYIFEQSSIVGILAEPGDAPSVEKEIPKGRGPTIVTN